MSALPLLFAMTSATLSPSRFWMVCVAFVKRMSMLAVRPPRGKHRWAIAAPCVFEWRNRFNVGWIHATPHTAQVVRLKAIGEGAN